MTFRIGIEIASAGARAVIESFDQVGSAAKRVSQYIKDGFREGIDDAIKEISRPREELEKRFIPAPAGNGALACT